MKWLPNLLLSIILFSNMGDATAQGTREDDINLLPMYGGVKKSRALQKADARLLASFPNRREAATQFAQRGWDFFYANDFTTAIKRYNQAWLLDSTNASAYWGFGVIEGQRQHHTDALRYFQISLRQNPGNRRLMIDMAQTLLSRYEVTHHSPDLDTAINRLQEYLTDTSDAKGTTGAYMRMAIAYYFKHDYISAWKYVDQTNALDVAATHDWELLPKLQKAAPR